MASSPKHVLRKVAVAGKRVARPKNVDVRVREHLTPGEVEALAEAASRRGRYGKRDALAIRMAARHGFRVSELCELRWDQIDLRAGLIHISRKKNGVPSTHPLKGDEIRALRPLRRDWPDGRQVFVTERGAPFHEIRVREDGPACRGGGRFRLSSAHAHAAACLRVSLPNRGEDRRALQLWLGHRSIQRTVRYSELNAERFKDW